MLIGFRAELSEANSHACMMRAGSGRTWRLAFASVFHDQRTKVSTVYDVSRDFVGCKDVSNQARVVTRTMGSRCHL